uniref:GSKIP domain-containing protein n=1 Tax=Panagrolaimus sp. JU765 TaxID=591449 RepID=A0AC34QS34_9BILA
MFYRSIPMSLHKASSLSRCWFESGPHSRGESSLELEAIAAVHQLSFAVQSISVSEMLPRTPELIFVNVTTLEGQPYCLELTAKGWRVTSLRSDCMQGDFTRMELFTKYYDSLYDLMEVISPNYKQRFSEKLEQRLRLLEKVMIWWHRRLHISILRTTEAVHLTANKALALLHQMKLHLLKKLRVKCLYKCLISCPEV